MISSGSDSFRQWKALPVLLPLSTESTALFPSPQWMTCHRVPQNGSRCERLMRKSHTKKIHHCMKTTCRNCSNHHSHSMTSRNCLLTIRCFPNIGKRYLQVRQSLSAPEKSTRLQSRGATGCASYRSGRNQDDDCRDPK